MAGIGWKLKLVDKMAFRLLTGENVISVLIEPI